MSLRGLDALAVKEREVKHLLFALAERNRNRQRNRSRPVGRSLLSVTLSWPDPLSPLAHLVRICSEWTEEGDAR